MLKFPALLISVLFQPLLMASYGCALLFFLIPGSIYNYLTPFDTKVRITFMIFLFTFLFPVVNIFLLYKLKRISSFTLSQQHTRTYPYITTSIFYFGLFYLVKDLNIWANIKLFVLSGGVIIFLCAMINMKYKISAHMAGIGGLMGLLINAAGLIQGNLLPYYIGIIVLAGIIGSARLLLQEHVPSQIYAGFALGIVTHVTLFLAFQKLITG
jgi:hypothetical protein